VGAFPGELDPEPDVLDDACGGKIGRVEQPPRQAHTGAGQVDASRQALKPALTDEILEQEGKGGQLHQWPCPR
jgi:hypothetical protein